jgi:DNA primase
MVCGALDRVMSFTPAFLDELRTRTSLSRLIGKSVKLTRAGREYKGCCPFHNEKTPSFTVNDDKGFYHCFGCSAHGDAIRWMTDNQGLDFLDAVKELAQAANLVIPAPDAKAAARAQQAQSLYDICAAASSWFQVNLAQDVGAQARAYLKSRGISPALAQRFGIGFAPDVREGGLKSALKSAPEDKLIEAGLLIQVEGKPSYDRFRNRLIIPIKDARGRVIGFGGRILGQGEPKYLNSPETPLFHKGHNLFNLDKAATATRTTHRLIVVEGYMDVIGLAGAGIEDAVAPLGTALTETQLQLLWRRHDTPLLCFDGDRAGQAAALRALHRALPMLAPMQTLAFVTLPEGQDPDDVVRMGGKAAFETLLANAQPFIDMLWHAELQAKPLVTPEARADFKARLFAAAQTIADAETRAQYKQMLGERFRAHIAPAPRPAFTPYSPNSRTPYALKPSPMPLSQTQALGAAGTSMAYENALLTGLLRYPHVIYAEYEAIGHLDFKGKLQNALKNCLLEAAYNTAGLDSAAIITICAEHGLGHISQTLLGTQNAHNALHFSFTAPQADRETAAQDLARALTTQRRMHELRTPKAQVQHELTEEDWKLMQNAHANAQAFRSTHIDEDIG